LSDVEEKVREILSRGDGKFLITGAVQAVGSPRRLAKETGVPLEVILSIKDGFGRSPAKSTVRKLASWIEENGFDPEELVLAGLTRMELEYNPEAVLEALPEELRREVEGKDPTELDVETLIEVGRRYLES